jgi:hypothetical protein
MPEPNDDQGTILRWEDHIVPILKHPEVHIRDKALVAVAWDVFPQLTELHHLSFGDLEDEGDYMTVRLTNRQGHDRRLALHKSTSYLRKWIEEEHPVNELIEPDAVTLEKADPETPLWAETQRTKPLSSIRLQAILKETSERADVSVEITLNNIRWSRVVLLTTESSLRVGTLERLLGQTIRAQDVH